MEQRTGRGLGGGGAVAGEGRREAREAGRARRAPALVGGCEQVAVGVCRACQQLCQERLARARAQEAGSCQPPARAARGVRTPPNPGSHRLLPHPHQPSGLGIPGGQRRRREPCWNGLQGGEKGEPCKQTTAQPGCLRTLLLASRSSPSLLDPTPPRTYWPAWVVWGGAPPLLIPPHNSQAAPGTEGEGESPSTGLQPHLSWGQEWEAPRPGLKAPRGVGSQETQKQAEQLQGC